MRRLLVAPLVLLRGRRDVGPGEAPLPYSGSLGLQTAVLLGLTLVGVAVVAIVVPWAWPRAVLLLAGAGTALTVLASWCAAVVYPHLVGHGRLRLRQGAFGWQDVALDDVATVEVAARRWPRSGIVSDGDAVGYVLGGGTTLAVTLGTPVPLAVRGGQRVAAGSLHLSVDDPQAALEAFRATFGGTAR